MPSSQFISIKHILPDHEAGPCVPDNFFEELKEKEEKAALEKKLK